MNRLLIVEDEKMIRQGLKVMAQRAPVEINEIIECRNGEEALEILKTTHIDVMFTDVRMPKKDGITLVKEMQALPHKPHTVIISGFDDFSYAVDALRCGAKEYILKPVERQVITDVLIKLNNALEEEKAEASQPELSEEVIYQQLKYFLLNAHVTPEEFKSIQQLFEKVTQGKKYKVCTMKSIQDNLYTTEDVLAEMALVEQEVEALCWLKSVGDFDCILVSEDVAIEKIEHIPSFIHWGVSQAGESLDYFRSAYKEAIEASKMAYLTNRGYVNHEAIVYEQNHTVSNETIKKWVQLLGTHKIEELLEVVTALFAEVKQGHWQVATFEEMLSQFLKRISENYGIIIETILPTYEQMRDYYSLPTIEDYEIQLISWLKRINEQAVAVYDDSKNKKKLQEAIEYIHQNYNKDLNMAMVSNHISMNYSVFSQLFKEYIGINFVNYLKEIRIEKAKELLTNTDDKIIEISVRVGYENEKHFMKVFKNMVGVSPSEYRKNSSLRC